MGISAAARTAAAIACRFLFGCVCGADAGKTKKRGTVYGRFTAFHKYGGDFGGGIPIRGYDFPRIAARSRSAQAAKNPQMDVPLYQKYAAPGRKPAGNCCIASRRLSLPFCSTAWRSPENGRGTGRTHSEKRRVLLTFAYKARCGNSCGWRIGRMCKTRQASSESS